MINRICFYILFGLHDQLTYTVVQYRVGGVYSWNEEVLEKGLQAIKLAADAGVTVCFGPNLLGPMHFARSKEFSIRSKVLSPLQILRTATVDAARLIMHEDHWARFVEGS